MIMPNLIESQVGPAPSDFPEGQASAPLWMDVVDRIYSVTGPNTVLIPVRLGGKVPVIKHWQKTTRAQMLDSKYLTKLKTGNIGVLLGAVSGNICAIDIDDDSRVEPFLAANLRLSGTLRTRGNRGCQLWVRVIGEPPPRSTKIVTRDGCSWGEWRADGNQSVIYGRHECGREYQWLVDAPVVEVAFDDIVWPEDINVSWPDRAFRDLVAEVGSPIVDRLINVSFFARVFALRNAVAVRRGQICIYDPDTGLWCPQAELEIDRKIWSFIRSFLTELDAREGVKERLRQATVDEIRGLLRTEGQVVPESSTSRMIHVKNGMLDLSQEPPALLPFSSDYGSMQRVEVNYDPSAVCPRFNAWLQGAMDAQDVFLAQEWVGAVNLGVNYAHRILLLSGQAKSGKTSFVSLVQKFVGENACYQLRTDQLGGRFETREYANKRLLMGNDVPADFLTGRHTAILKSLTGGDLLTAERKMENEGITFRGDFHMVIGSNEELTLRVEGDADAWERRLLSIHMIKPEGRESIPDIAGVLFREEGEGILAWLVAGARRHILNGYHYALSPEQQGRVQRIVDASDGVRLFVQQRLVVDESGKSQVTMEQLFEAYEQFAKEYDLERFKKLTLGKKLVPLIKSRLGLHQRHDLASEFLKPGATLRGYKGLIVL